MDESPRKVAESGNKCFLCSKSCLTNNKIFVFGKSSINISSLISTAIDVDLNTFSQSDDLVVCKNSCYKVLLKFGNCIEKYEKIKKEIKEKYSSDGQLRSNRLLQTEEGTQHSSSQAQRLRLSDRLSPPSAAKSLQFYETTTSTSSTNSTNSESCRQIYEHIYFIFYYRTDSCFLVIVERRYLEFFNHFL